MTSRRILFWVHLSAGSVAGLVILVMSFTGVLLAYERQIVPWADRGYRSSPPSGDAARMPLGSLLAGACSGQRATPSNVAVHADPVLPVEMDFGRDRVVYFDAYSGRAIGAGSQRVRSFFQAVEGVHRWLGASPKYRPAARLVTGICNLAFLLLVSSGVVLWWPRSWSWQRFKGAVTWRFGLPHGRARHWNWHTVTGFWCALPLLVIVLCGVVMSFSWANNLLYRMAGSPLPAPQQGPQAVAAALTAPGTIVPSDGRTSGTAGQRRGRGAPASLRASESPANADSSGNPRSARTGIGPCSSWDADRVNGLWARAEGQVAGWQTISLRLPAPGTAASAAVFSIDQGNGGRPDLRSQLTLDWRTGQTVRWEPFSSYSLGRRLRSWVRFSHTAEAGGMPGQTVAALATAGTTVLVFTGLAMVSRRLLGLRKAGAEESSPAGARQFPSAQPLVEDSVEQSVLADRLAGKKRPDEGEPPVGAEQSNGVGQAAGKVD